MSIYLKTDKGEIKGSVTAKDRKNEVSVLYVIHPYVAMKNIVHTRSTAITPLLSEAIFYICTGKELLSAAQIYIGRGTIVNSSFEVTAMITARGDTSASERVVRKVAMQNSKITEIMFIYRPNPFTRTTERDSYFRFCMRPKEVAITARVFDKKNSPKDHTMAVTEGRKMVKGSK